MRLFIGSFAKIYHYEEIKKDFGKYFEGKWVERENIHLTFKFLGEIENEKIVIDSLNNLKYTKEVFEINSIESFGKIPKVLFAKIDTKKLFKIKDEIEERLSFLPKDKKNFHPHITLLRIKKVKNFNYKELIKIYKNKTLGSLELEICLVKSTLSEKGAKYEIIKRF